ncbi:MAG: hypothetical protein EOO16_11940 [Chitinophagaceae bacterium]|nr:MAG: hypothetical protein EOO16_11940 [Chitinophagaceae bacterium]
MYEIALIHDSAPALLGSLPANARIVAATSLEGAAAPSGAAAFAGIDELLVGSSAPLVWVHTRTGYHAEYAIKALQAGRDVLCNAPLCITNSAAWQILETARYTRRRIWVADAACAFWKQLRTEIGAITRLHAWARSNSRETGNTFPDGGLLHTRFYALAKALATLTGPLLSAEEQIEHEGDGERGGHAALHFGEDATGYLDWSLITDSEQAPGFSVQAEGSKGKATIAGTFGADDSMQISVVNCEGITLADPGTIDNSDANWQGVLTGGEVPEWNAFDALRTVEFIDRIYGRVRKLS